MANRRSVSGRGSRDDLRGISGIQGGSRYKTNVGVRKTSRPDHVQTRATLGTRDSRVTTSSVSTHAARSAHAKARRKFATYDTSAIKAKTDKRPLIIIAVIVVVVLVAGFLIAREVKDPRHELAPTGTEVTIVVSQGETSDGIAEALWDAGLIERKSSFTSIIEGENLSTQLKAGTYVFTAGSSVDDIVDKLVAGAGLEGDKLVIPEGYTLSQIAQTVQTATNGRITAEQFEESAADASVYSAAYPFLAEAGTAKLEGFLYPSTYGITSSMQATDVVKMMLDEFSSVIATLDLSYPQSKGLSTYDFVKLASIVQREGKQDSFSRIAGIFYNRLDADMALQSDATTAYEVGHDPSAEEVHADSAYSTYTNKGLPPTPINNPGLEVLQATAHPEETDYLYFISVDNEDGTTDYHYSETYEEHEALVEELL